MISHFPLTSISSEVFVSDQGTNLFALDLRTGRITYGYKGMYLLSVWPLLMPTYR